MRATIEYVIESGKDAMDIKVSLQDLPRSVDIMQIISTNCRIPSFARNTSRAKSP